MADETGAARVDLGRRAIGFAAKIERNSGNGFNQAGKEGTILESPETKPRKEPPRLVLAVAAGDFAPRDAPADAGHSHCFGANWLPSRMRHPAKANPIRLRCNNQPNRHRSFSRQPRRSPISTRNLGRTPHSLRPTLRRQNLRPPRKPKPPRDPQLRPASQPCASASTW